jgi:hypothetical protein
MDDIIFGEGLRLGVSLSAVWRRTYHPLGWPWHLPGFWFEHCYVFIDVLQLP